MEPENSLKNFDSFSPHTLAYIGDCVYELFVRNKIILEYGNIPSKKLHNFCVSMARASFQSKIYFIIEDILNDKEKVILKRGRNSNSISIPKNCSVKEYRFATGVECLFGYLYLNGEFNRLDYIFNYIYDFYKKEILIVEKT